jgi:hypothetical protein
METIIDNYKEHKFHRGNTRKYQDTCSTCYSERHSAIKVFGGREESPRSVDWELASERSAHSEEDYW